MATVLLSPNAKQYFTDDDGAPLAGGKVYTYAANTTTPQATYKNRAGTVPNTNPIILDARGECVIYLTPGVVYDYKIERADASEVWTREDVIADAGDANAVAYDDPVAPAYLKTLSDMHNAEPVSVLRAIPKNLWAGIQDGTNTTHLSAYLNDLFAGVNTHKRGELTLPDGTYLLDEPLIYLPKTTFRGAGFGRSTLKVDPLAFPTTGGIYQIMRNNNYDTASSLEDGFVVVDGLAFDYNGLGAVTGGGSHAFTARYLRYVRILNCWFKGGENATALLACNDTLTQGCVSIDPENCGFDHWDGFSVAKVIGCTVRRQGAASTDQGIQFTADSSLGAARTSSQIVCVGNVVSGISAASATAIMVNALNVGSAVNDVTIGNNIVTDSTFGTVLQGKITNATVGNNVYTGGGQAVVVKSSPAGSPDQVSINDNTSRSPTVGVGDVAVFSLAGSNINCIDNVISGNSFPYGIWTQGSGTVKGNAFATGSTGRILDGSGGSALIVDDDTVNQRFDFNKKIRAPSITFGSDTAAVNALDDYEHGTWSPVDASGAALPITAQGGHYVKIGKFVFANCQVTYPATASPAGALLSGLPFSASASATNRAGGSVTFSSSATLKQVSIQQGGTQMTPRSDTGVQLTNTQMSGVSCWFSFVYRID